MNPIHLKPIGRLGELGCRRKWLRDGVGLCALLALLIVAYYLI